jgi:transcriptional regulator of acetoin/glycerol metabolism
MLLPPTQHRTWADTRPGNPGFLNLAWERRSEAAVLELGAMEDEAWLHAAVVDVAAVRVLRGETLRASDRRILAVAAREEVPWSRRLIVCLCLAKLRLRENDVQRAATACSQAVEAYRGFKRLQQRLKRSETPALLVDFENMCAHVLRAFEPPIAGTADPVRALARLVARMPRPRIAHPTRTMDALDALVSAGRSPGETPIQAQVVKQLAAMLSARVLFHYENGVYLQRESQDVHTLSSWSMRKLVADRRLVAKRVRPAPEFWLPEQRRPAGVLSVPLGEGLVVLARGRRFRPREVAAVRTVLRFLDVRLSTPASVPMPQVLPALGRAARPTVSEGLVGTSAPWMDVLNQVKRIAPSDCSIVLLGDTGTGKERLARAIHAYSERAQGAFVPVNCGVVPQELVASELFGHIRGAFTGAERNRDGLFVQAHGGTLFLDEVAEMSPAMQVAMLRVLEERRVTPVGSARPRPVDVRVVSATNVDLSARVESGRFREDLWHRLNVFVLRVPPLRERQADLPLLAAHILARLPERKALHPDALEVLVRYAWPGNVRELENVLRAGCLLSDGPLLTPDMLDRLLESRREARAQAAPPRLAPRHQAILQAVGDRWTSAAEVAAALGASVRTINREIADLLDQGLLRSSGQGRASRYQCVHGWWRDLARFTPRQPTPV